jgi:hypothetical protein
VIEACELEEPWRKIYTEEKSDSSTRALWQSYKQSHLVANQEEHEEGNYDFFLFEVSLPMLRSDF